MFGSQTEIVQLLLLCCIVIQSCLLHEVGSSLTPLKAESEPPSEGATTDDGNDDGNDDGDDDGDDDGTSTGNIRRIENNRPSGCWPRCRRDESNARSETSTKKSKVPKAYRNSPYVERLLKRRSVESYDRTRDYVQGKVFRGTLDGNRPLEKEVSHILDDVNGLTPDSKDYPKNASSISPSVESSVVFNCDAFWECIGTYSLMIELSVAPRKPLSIKFRGIIGPPKRNARSVTFDNDDIPRSPVYASIENIIIQLIKFNKTGSPVINDTEDFYHSLLNIILYSRSI